jgi:predicted transcriptional regulator
MKHDPADFARNVVAPEAQDAVDRRLDALLATLPPCPGIPSGDEEIAASDARAMADVAAGRFRGSATVREWLDTRPDPSSSFRDWIASRDG